MDEGLYLTNTSLNALLELLFEKEIISKEEFNNKVSELEEKDLDSDDPEEEEYDDEEEDELADVEEDESSEKEE